MYLLKGCCKSCLLLSRHKYQNYIFESSVNINERKMKRGGCEIMMKLEKVPSVAEPGHQSKISSLFHAV